MIGIMIKKPKSIYNPGTRKDWFKVKPDYFDNFSDDIDVLIGMAGKSNFISWGLLWRR
jgi:ATP-dependent DNA ligase